MHIVHSNDRERIEALISQNYEPIECSIDGKSLVGPLKMDHHGDNSALEGVAVRAYRDARGACKEGERDIIVPCTDLRTEESSRTSIKYIGNERFVVTGKGDADATFCIAALMGFLPDGLDDLAMLINEMDTNPIGLRLEEKGTDGARVLLFNQLTSGVEDATAFYAGVDTWRWMFQPWSQEKVNILLDAALEGEKTRVNIARQAKYEKISDDVALVESNAWGFDVWYADIAPCVVALAPDGNITVGAPNIEKAEQMFGPGGLKNIWDNIQPEGWGGRECIGGSPRGREMTRDEALEAANYIASQVKSATV